jgi:ABC-type cobalamin/Fe3+-siderophores transport system ATPase subunit
MPPKKAQPVPALAETLKGGAAEPTLAAPARAIPLQNIDTLQVPDPKFGMSMILIGSTRSGKSTLINYLYKKYFTKHVGVLMSNSLQSDAYDFIKKKVVTSDLYHPEVLKEMYMINHATDNHYPFLVILDDLTHVRHDKQYQRLLTIYRNSKISAVVSAQSMVMMDRTARSNINFVMLGRLNADTAVEAIIKEYLISYFPRNINMAEKIALYRQLTEDHYWLMIDNVNGIIFRTKLVGDQVMT